MANKLIINCSLEPQIETTETVDSKVYTTYSIEQNVGSNGGSYGTSATSTSTFTDAKAIKYTGTIDGTTSTAVASAGTWTTTGSAPTNAKAFYVRFDSELGSPGQVWVYTQTTVHAKLNVGEAVCIPYESMAVSNCKIKSTSYDAGVDVASATVVLIGT